MVRAGHPQLSDLGFRGVRITAHPSGMRTVPTLQTKPRALLITEDVNLIDDTLHLAAAAGADVFVAATASRSDWAASPLVLVGGDALPSLVRQPLERRRDVIVILREDSAEHAVSSLGASPEPWRDAVAIGAEHVIVLPEAARWLGDRLSSVAEGPCRNGSVVAVVGATGGVGASTASCAMALAARRTGRSVLLVDGDPYGGGLDLVMGCESLPGARWADLSHAIGRISAASLDEALPHPHGIALLSFGRSAAQRTDQHVQTAVLDAGVRGYDVVVVDQPRTLADAHLDAQHVLFVVPNRIRGVAAAAVALPELAACAAQAHVVLRRSPRGIAPRDVERALARSVIGEIADDPRIANAAESGDPIPDAMVRAASQVLERAGVLSPRAQAGIQAA